MKNAFQVFSFRLFSLSSFLSNSKIHCTKWDCDGGFYQPSQFRSVYICESWKTKEMRWNIFNTLNITHSVCWQLDADAFWWYKGSALFLCVCVCASVRGNECVVFQFVVKMYEMAVVVVRRDWSLCSLFTWMLDAVLQCVHSFWSDTVFVAEIGQCILH